MNSNVKSFLSNLQELNDANTYVSMINVILIDDDRAKPIVKHFIEMIKRSNEGSKERTE